jgi:hypothetical protein
MLVYIEVLHFQFVHRKISTLTFETHHVYHRHVAGHNLKMGRKKKVVPEHAKRAYGGLEVHHHIFLTLALDGG